MFTELATDVRRALRGVRPFSLVIALPLVIAGCPAALDHPERFGATKCDADAQIISKKCALSGCHTASDKGGGLDLQSPGYGPALVGAPSEGGPGLRIDPSTPDNSVLLEKLSDPPPFLARMPLGGSPLTSAEIECLRTWVFDLAASGGADSGAGGAVDASGAGDLEDAAPE